MNSISVNGHDLVKAKREIDLPFTLPMRIDGQGEAKLEILELLRVLPGKRLVVLATHKNTQFVLKIFIGRTAKKYFKKELSGISAIGSLGIKTPRLMWKARLPEGGGRVLAFEYLENCKDLDEVWKETIQVSGKVALLDICMNIFAAMHLNGMRQKDIHLNNFVVFEGEVYTIDGGGMSFNSNKSGLDKETSVKNLARFFAQFKPSNDQLVKQVRSSYLSLRGWSSNDPVFLKLEETIDKMRNQRREHYLLKTLRDCSRFICKKSLRRFVVCERNQYTESLVELLSDPDKLIDQSRKEGLILKEGNSATVARVHTPDGDLVIKRYNARSMGRIIRKALRPSRARNSWVNAHQLEFLGVASLRPVAMMEKRFGPFVLDAYFVSEYVGGKNLDDCHSEKMPLSTADKEKLVCGVVAILSSLKSAMISHGDLKASNFRYNGDEFILLDLDSMKYHRNEMTFAKAQEKDLNRFLENWRSDAELYRKFNYATENLRNLDSHRNDEVI